MELEITGLKELEKTLNRLPEATQRLVVEPSVREGAEVIKDLAVEKVSRKTGQTARDIAVKMISNLDARRAAGETREVDAQIYVKKRSAAKARWIEFGTAPHVINARGTALSANGEILGKSVSHPGQPARPFMRPAYDEGARKAIEKTVEGCRRRLADLKVPTS